MTHPTPTPAPTHTVITDRCDCCARVVPVTQVFSANGMIVCSECVEQALLDEWASWEVTE